MHFFSISKRIHFALMKFICQIDALDDKNVFLADFNGNQFRVSRELICDPALGSYYQIDGTFVKSGVFEPTSTTALVNKMVDVRAKLLDGEFAIRKPKAMGIDLLGKENAMNNETKKENGIMQRNPSKIPMRTQVVNGTEQLYVEVKRSDRVANEENVYCPHNFPLVLDSAGFLSRFIEGKEEGPKVRHAPEQKFGIWCSRRRHSFNGIHWKIVRVDPESKPKKALIIANGNKSNSKESKPKGGQLSSLSAPAHPSSVRNAPKIEQEMDETDNELYEGLVCSQNDTHFLVHCPGREWKAHLDKKESGKDGFSVLGMWIQFKIKSKAGVKLVDKRFTFTTQKIRATPTEDYVLVRCHLKIPRAMELGETPWCEELRANVTDKAEVLKHKHYGKTVLATFGCPSQVAPEDSDKIQWQLLEVEN